MKRIDKKYKRIIYEKKRFRSLKERRKNDLD